MKKSILIIFLLIALFSYNFDFKPKIKPSKYIYITDGKIKANKAYFSLTKNERDSLLTNLNLK